MLDEHIRRIEPLVDTLEASPDAGIRDAARELVATLLDYQAEALHRILEELRGPEHESLVRKLSREPLVESLLLLHGLHPEGPAARVERALDKARPSLRAHKGDVEVISFGGNELRLRLVGTCNGCPSSTTTFRNLIETSVQELVPEVDSILVEGLDFQPETIAS